MKYAECGNKAKAKMAQCVSLLIVGCSFNFHALHWNRVLWSFVLGLICILPSKFANELRVQNPVKAMDF
jgi:hypothetical protein